MGLPPVVAGANGDDALGVELIVGRVVVLLDLVYRHRARDPRPLVELARIAPQVLIIDDAPAVAAEVQVVDLIEARQRREQPPVGLGDALTGEVATLAEQLLEPVEAVEQQAERALVGGSGRPAPRTRWKRP